MNPATHAMAWSASTSELPRRICPMSSAVAGRVRPGKWSRVASGTCRVATTHTAKSSAVAMTTAPATHGPMTWRGRRFHASSVERVDSMPRTRTKSLLCTPTTSACGADPLSALAAAQTHLRHAPDCLEGDSPRHLAGPGLAVAEDDRDLLDPEAVADGAKRELDLERVALRAHGVEVDRLEHLAPVALEAASEVAHGQAEDVLGVPAPATGHHTADGSPTFDAATVDVARPNGKVGVGGGRQQPRQVI